MNAAEKITWPAPVPLGVAIVQSTPRPRVNLTALDALGKRLVWECIKRRRPALAALLKDPQIEALRLAFNGNLILTID